VLAGPAILILADIFTSHFGHFSDAIAQIVVWTAAILPGIGSIICYIVLIRLWKRTKKLGRALAIVTAIMCNPLFYLIYIIICSIMVMDLAGHVWNM
jgi:uncharacterized membrane protein